jgi:hypothetical protein
VLAELTLCLQLLKSELKNFGGEKFNSELEPLKLVHTIEILAAVHKGTVEKVNETTSVIKDNNKCPKMLELPE